MILTALKYNVDRFLKWGILLCVAGAAVVMGWAFTLFFLNPSAISKTVQDGSTHKMTQVAYLFPLEAIGNGPLALRPKIACGWVSRIAEEFSVIAFNSRPDVLQKDAKILVAMSDGKEQAIVHNGKALFLKERIEGKGLAFSESSTALWVKPILLDNGNVLIEVGRKMVSKDGQCTGEEKGEFIASLHRSPAFRHQESQLPYLAELKTAVHLGNDPLISQYGGKEYADWKDKIKCEFASDTKSYAVFVSAGDFLQFKHAEWRCIRDGAIDASLPLAQVISVTPKEVHIRAWDESGFFFVQTSIAAGKLNPSHMTHDVLPTGLRMRSNTQVSCIFGKKRLIIKKGDWLLKTTSGWRNLRKAQEIEDCLFHRLKGELFIFDQIEKQQGKSMLQGHLFDSSRTNVTLVVLPIDTEKKGSQSKNKKDKPL